MIAWLAANPLSSALGIALAASLAFGGWQCSQKNEARTDAAEAHTALAEYEASIAKEREVFERQARATEQRHAADMQRISRDYELDKAKAISDANQLVSDLRSGTVRLREQWRSCAASSGVPRAGAPAGERDDADGLREAGIERILGIVGTCQAQRDALLNIAEADRAF